MEWLSGKRFDPNFDFGKLSGKAILVTGGNNGLGVASVRAFAKHNYLTVRNPSKAEAIIADIKYAILDADITYLQIDLASFDSVKKAAEAFKTSSNDLHVLMSNAGTAGRPPSLTEEGYETHFGTNHTSHALLTMLLLPLLELAAEQPGFEVRIISGLVLKANCTPIEDYSASTSCG
ncbi:MAG: hypothetical protein Q9191_000180 [Dirinaria sp. TL-2023a]